MKVLVNDTQDMRPVPQELLLLLEKIGLDLLELEGPPPGSEVSIVLVDNAFIRELNVTYRGLDKATDVLSFNLSDERTGMEGDQMLGDVFISVEKADEQAREYGHSLEREVAFLAVHGILHLLGYDHQSTGEEEAMITRQKSFLERYNL